MPWNPAIHRLLWARLWCVLYRFPWAPGFTGTCVEEFGVDLSESGSGRVFLLLMQTKLEGDFHLAFSALTYGLLAAQIGGLLPLIQNGFRLNLAFAGMIAMECFADGTRHKYL
jgi:hypothetical protein